MVTNGLLEFTNTADSNFVENAGIYARTCIDFEVNNVTINLKDENVTDGILIETGEKCTVSNCTVIGGETGVQAVNATTEVIIDNCHIENPYLIGINLSGDKSMAKNNIVEKVDSTNGAFRGINTNGSVFLDGNKIDIPLGQAGDFGILSNTSVDGKLIIIGNQVLSQGTNPAIRIQSGCTDAVVANNIMNRTLIDLGTNTIVSDNLDVVGY